MKRFATLLPVLLAATVFCLPITPAAAAPSTAKLAERTAAIFTAAKQQNWSTVQQWADPQVETFLRGWHGDTAVDQSSLRCRRSSASRPSKPITFCRFRSNWTDNGFWTPRDQFQIWYRETPSGRWIAMKLTTTPAKAYTVKAKLAVRTAKLIRFAWDGEWDRTSGYLTSSGVNDLTMYNDEARGRGADTVDPTGRCRNFKYSSYDLGYLCEFMYGGGDAGDPDYIKALFYVKLYSGRWVAKAVSQWGSGE